MLRSLQPKSLLKSRPLWDTRQNVAPPYGMHPRRFLDSRRIYAAEVENRYDNSSRAGEPYSFAAPYF